MITEVFIKNYKAFERKTINIYDHNIIIGENDAGKTTLLSALEIFFNLKDGDKIDKKLVRDQNEDVEIQVTYNGKRYKKIYSPPTYKLKKEPDDIDDLNSIRYIYIPINSYDSPTLINKLALAKAIENTSPKLLENLKNISQDAINEVISTIPEDLVVISNGVNTNFIGKQDFKYESAVKFIVESDGVAVESRGSGFQKNLMYALLIGTQYDNVILGIDEIENSFSVNNCREFLTNIQNSLGQTLITTHSKELLKIRDKAEILPIYNQSTKTITELLTSLDNNDEITYLLVEGKYDIVWYRKVLNLLGVSNKYLVLPSGGKDNVNVLLDSLNDYGKNAIYIKDGDTRDERSIQKDCIELYIPLDYYNSLFGLNEAVVPDNEKDFFKIVSDKTGNTEDKIKKDIAKSVYKFLDIDNPLINEIKNLLNIEG